MFIKVHSKVLSFVLFLIIIVLLRQAKNQFNVSGIEFPPGESSQNPEESEVKEKPYEEYSSSLKQHLVFLLLGSVLSIPLKVPHFVGL